MIRPICFQNQGIMAENKKLTIIGMGMTKSSRKMKEGALKLQEARVKLISDKKCYKELRPPGLIIPRSFNRIKHKGICVKGANKETACMNDSGSGAFGFNEGGSAFLIGVAFYGGAKCRKELMLSGKGLPKKSVRPTIYIPIAGKIYEWIKNHDSNNGIILAKEDSQQPIRSSLKKPKHKENASKNSSKRVKIQLNQEQTSV